ncbi:TlpA family protein disulfide reductase [Pedobacter aquatilis]|uniref:TlpA family protein disulfide reductase n=1 Tax=Pedobacter aquatilis TaxID=351343 RepID=UPI003977A19B
MIGSRLTKKFLILDFWFLSCIPCIRDHKEVLSNLRILDEKNAEMVSISTDKDLEKWRNYVLKNRYVWRNYQQPGAATLTRDLSISTFPNYIILNSDNEVLSIIN